MIAEDVARRFERRPGYDLIDYSPVALPLYRLTVDAVTMVHREIPPIKEFVMRSLAAGLTAPTQIAGFLGLDQSIIDATLDQLQSDKYVHNPIDDGEDIRLTDRGVDVLSKTKESSPEDEMLVFLYDRLLLKPVRLPPEELLVPAHIDPLRVVEIRPYPAEGPDIAELSLADVLQVLEQQAGGRAAFGRDLLRLKRIVRRVRLFRPGVALVFKKLRSSEILVEFAVDDVRHEGLSHAFAERGGPKKMGFIKAIDESSTAADLRRYLGTEVQRLLPDAAALDEKRLGVSVARMKLQTAIVLEERKGFSASEGGPEPESIRLARSRLEEAERDLTAFPARPVAAFEIPEMLALALKKATKLLMISSRKVDRSVIEPSFLKRLEVLLQDGCNVVICVTDTVPTESDGPAVDLERLRSRYPRLSLRTEKKSGFFHLICDDDFALVSNRPFLGNLNRVRTFHHVVGYLLQREDLVRAFRDKVRPNGMSARVGAKAPGRVR